MRYLIILSITLLFSTLSSADNLDSKFLVDIGKGVSQSSHLCTLKGKATVDDVNRIDKKLHKWHDENGVNITRSRLEPLFVGASTMSYDFIAVDWMTWETFGEAWDKFMSSSSGQSIFAEYNKIMDCSRVVGSMYPMFRNASAYTDNQGVVTINWCTRKESVSQDALIARHRNYRDGLNADSPIQYWGIGYPSAGARKGQFPGEFFHWNGYADMKDYAAAENNQANNEGWRGRADYYASYADCSGPLLMTHTILKRNN